MLQSREQIKAIAKGVVNGMVADMLSNFPKIAVAVDKSKKQEWIDFLDAKEKEIEQSLISRFNCSD